MLKNILKINGAQELNRKEQKTINGGESPFVCAGPGVGGLTTLGYAEICDCFEVGDPCTITVPGHGPCPATCAGGPTFWLD